MPKSVLIEIALSLAGVGLLVGVSWLLGAWRSATVTRPDAAERLSFDEPDLRIAEWFLSVDGRSAAALSTDGSEIALVFALGDCLATRRLGRQTISVEQRGATLRFILGEPSRRAVALLAPDESTARGWLSRLTGTGV